MAVVSRSLVWAGENRDMRRGHALAKRLIDVVAGGIVAVAVTPLIAVLAVALAVDGRSWPFFVHQRIGHRGRPFAFIKLRTLPKSVSPYALKTVLNEVPISRLALFMRRHHLDELPQLWLVPLGRMSLVGPRPKMPDAVEPVENAYGMSRVAVPQGCTGLWQIGEHKTGLPNETPVYDFFYLANRSITLDAWIIWRTVRMILNIGGPVGLDQVPPRLRRHSS